MEDVLASEVGTRHRMKAARARLRIIDILSGLFICFIIPERTSSNKAGSRPPAEYIFVLTFQCFAQKIIHFSNVLRHFLTLGLINLRKIFLLDIQFLL